MSLRDYWWPCEIKYGLARLNIALRDRLWSCKIVDGLEKNPIALQEGPWFCKTVDGFVSLTVRSNTYGLARSNMALRDQILPCKKTHGLARRPMTHTVLLSEVPDISLLLSKVTGIPPRPSRFRQRPFTRQRLFAGKSYVCGVNLFLTRGQDLKSRVSKKIWPEYKL